MGKKYIVKNGKKVYLDEEDNAGIKDEDDGEDADLPVADDQAEEGTETTEETDGGDEVDTKAKEVAKRIKSELGLDELNAKLDKFKSVSDNLSKYDSLVKGSQLAKNKNQMTKEEKIVGFFHALVTNDVATVKALSEGTAADGGNLFPNEFRYELIRWLEEANRMRSLVRVIPMQRDVMNIPNLESSVKLTWTAEKETKSTTTAHFGQKTLTARKVAAILYASDELIADSSQINVVDLVISLFGEELANEEDRVITAGNGTTEPTGFVTTGAGHTFACAGNLSFDNIINLVYALPQKYHSNAVFVVHRTNIRELRKLKDSNGQYLWVDRVAQGLPPTLMGYPVYENNWVGEANIFFGDFKRGYYLGDRQQLTVKITQDSETAFTKDLTGIRVVARIAGLLVLPDAVASITAIP